MTKRGCLCPSPPRRNLADLAAGARGRVARPCGWPSGLAPPRPAHPALPGLAVYFTKVPNRVPARYGTKLFQFLQRNVPYEYS